MCVQCVHEDVRVRAVVRVGIARADVERRDKHPVVRPSPLASPALTLPVENERELTVGVRWCSNRILEREEDLFKPFEVAQIANLSPASSEEAKALIPSCVVYPARFLLPL